MPKKASRATRPESPAPPPDGAPRVSPAAAVGMIDGTVVLGAAVAAAAAYCGSALALVLAALAAVWLAPGGAVISRGPMYLRSIKNHW
jgi:hypothetical protein